jgi:hypothetical protein
MRSLHHTNRSVLALIATTCALLALPSAAPAQSGQDLRSPDARDAGLTAISGQDLRSPDSRDYAEGRYPSPVAGPVPVAETPTAPAAGFDWTAAAVGAAAALGLVLLMAAGVLLVRRRTHPDQPAAA